MEYSTKQKKFFTNLGVACLAIFSIVSIAEIALTASFVGRLFNLAEMGVYSYVTPYYILLAGLVSLLMLVAGYALSPFKQRWQRLLTATFVYAAYVVISTAMRAAMMHVPLVEWISPIFGSEASRMTSYVTTAMAVVLVLGILAFVRMRKQSKSLHLSGRDPLVILSIAALAVNAVGQMTMTTQTLINNVGARSNPSEYLTLTPAVLSVVVFVLAAVFLSKKASRYRWFVAFMLAVAVSSAVGAVWYGTVTVMSGM